MTGNGQLTRGAFVMKEKWKKKIYQTKNSVKKIVLNSGMVAIGNYGSATYNEKEMCEEPANQVAQNLFRDPGFTHTVEMINLEPNTRYSYMVGIEFVKNHIFWEGHKFFLNHHTDLWKSETSREIKKSF